MLTVVRCAHAHTHTRADILTDLLLCDVNCCVMRTCTHAHTHTRADILTDLLSKMSKGVLRPLVKAKHFSLDRIRQAHRESETVGVGKVVVRL